MDSISKTKENTISADVSQFSYWKKTHLEKGLNQCPEFQPCEDIVATAMHPQSKTIEKIAMLEEGWISFTFHEALLKKEHIKFDHTQVTKIRKQTLVIQTTDFKSIKKVKTEIFSMQRRYLFGSYTKTQCSKDFTFCVKKRQCEYHLGVWRN